VKTIKPMCGRSWLLLSTLLVSLCLLNACSSTRQQQQQYTQPGPVEQPLQSADVKKRAAIRLQLGVGYFQQGQYPVALQELNDAAKMDPTIADIFGVRALVYVELHETVLAEQDFQRAQRMAPENADIANNYAWFLCRNQREKEAMEMFEKVIKNPAYKSPAKVLINAGMCSQRMKNDYLAQQYLLKAIRFDPANYDANFNLAGIYYQNKDWVRAQFYIGRLVKDEDVSAATLWLGIKIAHKAQDALTEDSLSLQLRRRHPDSDESVLLGRGAFDE